MNDLDDKIRAALNEEQKHIFEQYSGHQSLLQMVSDSFRGRTRWLIWMVFVEMVIFLGLAIFCAVQFFGAETVRMMLAWFGGFIFCTLAVLLMKVWYWMELNKNALTREIKRVELEIAQLSSSLRNSA